MKATIEELLKQNFIHESKSPQASPTFFVEKKDGTKHLVQDYQT